MTAVSESITRWYQHYKEALATNTAAEVNDSLRLLAWSYACSKESLSLDEYVKVRQSLALPTKDVYVPMLMSSIHDWKNTWPQVASLLEREQGLSGLVIEHIQQYPTTPTEIVEKLEDVVNKWSSHHNTIQWYKHLDPQSAPAAIAKLTKGYHNPPSSVQDYIHAALTQIKVATPMYWKSMQDYVVGKIYTNDASILKFSEHLLTYSPHNNELTTYISKQTNAFIRAGAAVKAAQWAAQIVTLAPKHANEVMTTLQKGLPTTFSQPPLNSSKWAIDYFLNTDVTIGTNTNTASSILQSIIVSDASVELKENAFIRKLSVRGLRVEDLKNHLNWTPVMQAACNYWIASHIHEHMPKVETKVYTQLKKDVTHMYEQLHNVDLRNPEAYAQWENTNLIDFSKLRNVYGSLCTSWEEQCKMYAQHATLPKTEYTPMLDLHATSVHL